jgi:hypothetical protein
MCIRFLLGVWEQIGSCEDAVVYIAKTIDDLPILAA